MPQRPNWFSSTMPTSSSPCGDSDSESLEKPCQAPDTHAAGPAAIERSIICAGHLLRVDCSRGAGGELAVQRVEREVAGRSPGRTPRGARRAGKHPPGVREEAPRAFDLAAARTCVEGLRDLTRATADWHAAFGAVMAWVGIGFVIVRGVIPRRRGNRSGPTDDIDLIPQPALSAPGATPTPDTLTCSPHNAANAHKSAARKASAGAANTSSHPPDQPGEPSEKTRQLDTSRLRSAGWRRLSWAAAGGRPSAGSADDWSWLHARTLRPMWPRYRSRPDVRVPRAPWPVTSENDADPGYGFTGHP